MKKNSSHHIWFLIQGDKGEHGAKVRGKMTCSKPVRNTFIKGLIITFHLQGEVGPQGPAGPRVCWHCETYHKFHAIHVLMIFVFVGSTRSYWRTRKNRNEQRQCMNFVFFSTCLHADTLEPKKQIQIINDILFFLQDIRNIPLMVWTF